jgi:DNA-directed RNA polymerase sigma subunit (sigma70/sigma32)
VHTDDTYHDNQISEIANDEFIVEDESIEKTERQDVFRDLINRLMVNLKGSDRRILKKRFGIDYPFTLSINEIAEQEGLSTNTVKYSIQNSMKIINEKLPSSQKELIIDMLR